MAPTVTVHHLEMSRSTRVLWALEELGVEYELKTYRRHPKTFRAGPEIKAVHPVGRFPVVTVDALVLAESGAILEHLAEHFGALGPDGDSERIHYRYWMHFAEGSLMAPLLVALITDRLRTGVPFPANLITGAIGKTVDKQYTWPQLADLLAAVDAHLSGHAHFAGDAFTMADI
jgi:glutathione S-transferase